jgi:DNA-binding NarL/FixJ family response regulator
MRFGHEPLLTLLFVEDDELVRVGLRMVLEKLPNVHHVAAASNGQEALQLIADVQPHVVVTDVAMPVLDGIGLTREIRRRYPSLPVVILTGHPDEIYFTSALSAGAAGYVLKSSSVDEIEIAIRAVNEGEAYITPRLAKSFLPTRGKIPNYSAPPSTRLTLRQRQTLRLIAAGKTNKEIACSLNVTVKTVEKHRTELMRRLGVHNTAELLKCALQQNLT